MKALTLHQPWASLIACGAKRFETRDWAPPAWMVGQHMAIHAGKKIELEHFSEAFAAMAKALGVRGFVDLPTGAVLCTVRLKAVHWSLGMTKPRNGEWSVICEGGAENWLSLRPGEDYFGNYDGGRALWEFDEVQLLRPPIPARGNQKLWDWRPVP